MQKITLAQLREDIGFAADVPVGDNRVPNVTLNRLINRAIREYDELVSDVGLGRKVQVSRSSSTSTGTETDGFKSNQIVILPADFRRLVSVYVINSSLNERVLLRPISDTERQDPSKWYRVTSGPPRGYTILSETDAEEARLWIWPPSDEVYQLEVTYEPKSEELSSDSANWVCVPGTEDLVICKVAVRLLMRDGATQPNMIALLNERVEQAKTALENHANRDTGTLSMRDDQRKYRREAWLLGEL